MKTLHMAAYILLWVGGINWGLIGLFQTNVVNMLLSTMPQIEQLVYILVGVATVYVVATHMGDCKVCGSKK